MEYNANNMSSSSNNLNTINNNWDFLNIRNVNNDNQRYNFNLLDTSSESSIENDFGELLNFDKKKYKKKDINYFKKLKKKKIGKSKKKCIICCNKYVKEQIIRFLPCKHFFHNICIKPWLKENWNCPICRFDIKSYLDEIDD